MSTRTLSKLGLRNVARFTRHPLRFLERLAARSDAAELRMLGKEWLLVSHPDEIESVIVAHAQDVERDDYAAVLKRALGEGLLTSEGDLWKRQRRLASHAFTPKRIRGYAGSMVDVTARGLGRWRSGDTIDIQAEMSRLTMEVVAEVLFGASVPAEDVQTVRESTEVFNDFFAQSPEAVLRLPAWWPSRRSRAMTHAVQRIDELLFRIIDAKRADAAHADDLLGAMLAATDEDGTRMDDRQLRDETVTLFLAGHETTALALFHALYLLSKHVDAERKLRAELESVLGGRAPTAEDVPRLVYADRVVKETMRLFPPAWVSGRSVARPFEVAGRTMPVGSQILMSQWVVHRDPRWWPNPEAFDPDRFDPELVKKRPRFSYFPFGGGPRVCIGNHFAMMEAVLMLATMLSHWRIELLPFEQVDPWPSVTLRSRRAVRARITALDARAQARPAVAARAT